MLWALISILSLLMAAVTALAVQALGVAVWELVAASASFWLPAAMALGVLAFGVGLSALIDWWTH